MRRQFVTWMFVAGVGLAAPLGASASPATDESGDGSITPVAVQHVTVPAAGLRDEAAMVLVGTVLIGLAAAVRRAA
jgi:hypothetical protein